MTSEINITQEHIQSALNSAENKAATQYLEQTGNPFPVAEIRDACYYLLGDPNSPRSTALWVQIAKDDFAKCDHIKPSNGAYPRRLFQHLFVEELKTLVPAFGALIESAQPSASVTTNALEKTSTTLTR